MPQDQLTYIAETVGEIKGRLDVLFLELKGNGQPGFIEKTNTRLTALETDRKVRTWAGRVAYAVFTTILSVLLALKGKFFHGAH